MTYSKKHSILILLGTTSGNSELAAEELAEMLDQRGISYRLSNTEKVEPEILYKTETLLLLMSTDGDGEPPWMAEVLYNYLDEKTEADLQHLSYSVLALGDSSYDHFCQAGKDFDRMLKELGGQRFHKRVDCDKQFWPAAEGWMKDVCDAIERSEKKELHLTDTV